ncbi:MAG: zf-HC2 domain-containing protein [Candidatus Binataceae bacterium]
MADCSAIQPLLSAFEDGELEPHEMLEVARHLAGCGECECIIAGYGQMGITLRSLPAEISLDGFAAAVQARIAALRPSLRTRVGRWLDRFDERMTAAISLASAAIAIAALTAFVFTPYARRLAASPPPVTVASAPANPAIAENPAIARVAESEENNSVEDSRTIISRLEAQNPAVAVWSEPQTDTTVIWLPEQAHP